MFGVAAAIISVYDLADSSLPSYSAVERNNDQIWDK